ncbi:MAG: hypothetical protein ABI273_05095 [Lacunisphaera sp.]
MSWRLLFNSSRRALLHGVTVLVCAPVPFAWWLIARAPRAEWDVPLGPNAWWVIPAGLIALTLVLPFTVYWLHDRYVLRLERSGEIIRLTTFLLWGRRVRELPIAAFAGAEGKDVEGKSDYGRVSVNAPYFFAKLRDGRTLILDAAGAAPEGWHPLHQLGHVRE